MDTIQLLLTVALTISTILLIIIGIQLILVLKEFRKTIKKINFIVEGFEKIGLTVDHGFKEIAGFIMGAKTLFKIFDKIHSKNNGK